MQVRKGQLADLDQLAALFDSYRRFYDKPSDLAGARLFLSDRISRNESQIYVAEEDDGTLTGFVQLYPLFSSTRMRPLWLFNDLFVHRDHRGKDISIALINAAKALCRASGSCGMMLETAKDNFIANGLYHKTDWELDTEHNFYFWGV
jgi:GNAT superfamily N-acetyltransferase